MSPQEIEDVFHEASKLDPAERSAFVEKACAGDQGALLEINSLLAHDKEADILTRPAFDVLARKIAREQSLHTRPRGANPLTLTPGQRLYRYEIIEKLGQGAMGQVYRAFDTRLQTTVAIKVLPPDFSNRPDFADLRDRFNREAQAVRSVQHLHICTLYDIRCDNGIDYLVMELVEGETLRSRLARPLAISDFMRIAEQCLEALKAVHNEKVLHRDLKPENIMLDASGSVKLCDFGLAKRLPEPDAASSTITAQLSGGTLGYMAPELFETRTETIRSDIFSLGVVFYEALSGQHPFLKSEKTTPNWWVFTAKARPLRELNPAINRRLDTVVQKMLALNPGERYGSADEVLNELRVAMNPQRWKAVALGVLMLVSAGLTPGIPHNKNLAILGFEAIGGTAQDRIYCDGLTEMVTVSLRRLMVSADLQVASPEDVHALSVATPQAAQAELGANVVLMGNLKRVDNGIRIAYSLLDPATNQPFLRSIYEGASDNPDALQNEFIEWIARDLSLKLSSEQWMQIRKPRKLVPKEAYYSYLEGWGYLKNYGTPDYIDKAIRAFQEATTVYTEYADAYAGIGEAYWRKYRDTLDPVWMGFARQSCEQSITISPNLAEARTCLGAISNAAGDYLAAVEQFGKALHVEPNNDLIYRELAESKYRLGDLEGAEQSYRRAIEIRPDYWAVYTDLGRFYYQLTRYTEAVEQHQEAIRKAPQNPRVYYNLGGIYTLMARYEDAIESLQTAIRLRPTYQGYGNLGSTYMRMRRFEDAVRAFEQAAELNNREYVVFGNLARALYFAPRMRQRSRSEYEHAIRLAQEQFTVNPRDGNVHILLGRYYAALGERGLAMHHTQQGLNSELFQPNFLWHAAIVYNQLGNTEATLAFLRDAVARGFSKTEIRDTVEFDNLRDDPRFVRVISSN